ncbi:MAG: tetratricopeptide repeat protein [Bacteroidales bacterium]|nr:tetratricopeptide repeat protein [Bacteroidales bacterium]
MRKLSLYIALLLIFVSCSTKKNTSTRRAYHNLTAHYNAYFNGNEAIKNGVLTLEKAHKDNYTQIISIFPLGEKKDAQSVVPDMERAIEKASKVINKHSMEFKGVQYVKWIDDAYFMIGRANFYKKDYQKAYETFDFVTKKFNKDPIRFDAYLWMARSLIGMKKMNKTSSFLAIVETEIKDGGEVSSEAKKLFPMVMAEYLIESNQLDPSIEYLQKAIVLNKKKKTRIRLMFVLAQVYQKLEQNGKALEMYQKVLKKNPSYNIAFHCRVFSAQCYDASHGSSESIVKELHKMLKDRKNDDFRDEIYYALSNIAMKDGDEEQGIDYLKLSARYSTTNNYQKAITYLDLAEIFFAKSQYQTSQGYYDTAMMVLPKDFPNFDQIKDRHAILTELVENLLVIELQDSLQNLASMSEADRNAAIDKLIQDYIKEEELRKQREREKLAANNNSNDLNVANTNSNWYFYNASTVAFGKTEFAKKWGDRPLEDLWRLSNKEVVSWGFDEGGNDNPDGSVKDTIAGVSNPRDRKYYMKDIPLSDSAIAVSNAKIEKAFYKLGIIYKDYLKEYPAAIKSHEELLTRYPETKYRLETLYMLYSENKSVPDASRAAYYKGLIIKEFPNSDYAKILSDPNYLKVIASQKGVAEEAYESAYNDFLNERYSSVIIKSDSALTQFQDPDVLSRFDFIKAISMSKIHGDDTLKPLLKRIVEIYPGTDVKMRAEAMLAYLGEGDGSDVISNINNGNHDNVSVKIYKPAKEEDIHLYVILLNTKDVSINAIKALLSDFNTTYFKEDNLSVSSLYLNDDRIMVSVSHFKKKSRSMDYYTYFLNDEEGQKAISKASPVAFVISADNYPMFYKSKDEMQYLEFFERYYLEKTD